MDNPPLQNLKLGFYTEMWIGRLFLPTLSEDPTPDLCAYSAGHITHTPPT